MHIITNEEKNKTLMNELKGFVDSIKHMDPSLVKDFVSPFFIFSDIDANPLYFNTEHNKHVIKICFVCHMLDFANKDWSDDTGMTFSTRVSFLFGKHLLRNSGWYQMSVFSIAELITYDIVPYHPEFKYI